MIIGEIMNLADKVAIITGSSRGLGKSIALTLAKEKCNVVVNYIKNKDAAEDVVNKIRSMGSKAISIQADVSDEEQVQNMIERTIEEFVKIDILVNNAAVYEDSTVWKMDKDIWSNVINVDLTGVFNCTKHAIKPMREQGWGRIIMIASVVGQIGVFGTSNYTAAKAGIIGFSKAVAKEVARKGITVNTLSLGYFDIGMLKRLPEDVQAMILKQIPMGRWGKPEEVGKTILFLTSDDAAYITGQVINLNGGYYM